MWLQQEINICPLLWQLKDVIISCKGGREGGMENIVEEEGAWKGGREEGNEGGR